MRALVPPGRWPAGPDRSAGPDPARRVVGPLGRPPRRARPGRRLGRHPGCSTAPRWPTGTARVAGRAGRRRRGPGRPRPVVGPGHPRVGPGPARRPARRRRARDRQPVGHRGRGRPLRGGLRADGGRITDDEADARRPVGPPRALASTRCSTGRSSRARDRPAQPRPEADALIVYTSGTTGRPKGAVHTHASLLAGVGALVRAWGWQPDDRLLLALPLFHVHGLARRPLRHAGRRGLGRGVRPLRRGGHRRRRRDPGRPCSSACPPCTTGLAASGRAGRLAALRLCVCGSAPLAAELWHDLDAARASRCWSATA